MGDKIRLESMINPEGCSQGELRANLGRIQSIMGYLDQIFDFEFSDDFSTITFNLQNIENINVQNVNAYTYNDGGEVEYCFDYCPTAIDEVVQTSSDYIDEIEFLKQKKKYVNRIEGHHDYWLWYVTDGPGSPSAGTSELEEL